jgi:hypothetical protein
MKNICEYSIMVDTNNEKKRKVSKCKINDIPTIDDIDTFKKNNYTVPNLKSICKHYKLKVSGKKPELVERIYNFLHDSNSSIFIQKIFRAYLVRQYFKLLGPAFYNRKLCKNDTDFFTLEELNDIPNSQFFSYKENNNIWGFNILSIYNLFLKNNSKEVYNPYTRENINNSIFNNIKKIINLSKLLNKPINIVLNNDDDKSLSQKKKNEIKCLELFQVINQLGNYSDYSWFINLNRLALVRFIRELIDIWEYRAELSNETKCQICYPYGNPFRVIDTRHLNSMNFIQLQKNILTVINQFISKGVSEEHCNLGASYVLCSLTLVSPYAAEALPWLYHSVSNNT